MWSVPELWPGETVVCIASGPSLTQADVDLCRGHRVIVVNDNWRVAPWADALIAGDADWWARKAPAENAYAGLRISTAPEPTPGTLWLPIDGFDGLPANDRALRSGGNTGFKAVGLAVLFGASRIILLGYDVRRDVDGKAHWFGDHPEGMHNPILENFNLWKAAFQRLPEELKARGIEVINSSRDTALDCFPRLPLEEALR